MSTWLDKNRLELKTTLLYFVIASLWILISDRILVFINVDNIDSVTFQSTKGILFVSVTSLGLFALMAGNRREHIQRAERLARSERMQQLLFEKNPQPMWIYDQNSLRFLAVNEATVRAYGYTPDEFASMTIADIRPIEDVPRLIENLESERPILQDSGE